MDLPWDQLSRWERAEIGRALRRQGLSYGEIMDRIPVPKGTLAGWCRGITLKAEQVRAIRERTGSWRGVPRNTQRKRREEIDRIRTEAEQQVPSLIREPLWLAGTIMYWAEGGKTQKTLQMTDSDPRVLRLFYKTYIKPRGTGYRKNHLHWGVCNVRLRRSTDAWIRTDGWIAALARVFGELPLPS
jgi:hypothetical protein